VLVGPGDTTLLHGTTIKSLFQPSIILLYLYLKPVAPADLPEIPAILGAEAVLSSPYAIN